MCMADRFSAPKKRSVEWLAKIIADCVRDEAKLVERIDYNRKHLFKDPSVNPVLLPPYDDITYQSNRPAEVWREVKSRMTENSAIISARAVSGKSTDSALAEDVSQALNSVLALWKEVNGYSLQDGMCDGQIIDSRAVLGWERFDQGYPQVPAYEYCDEIPEGDNPEDWRLAEPEDDAPKKYVTSEKSLTAKLSASRAKYGFPYRAKVYDPRNVKFRPDTMGDAGVAIDLQTVEVMDYADSLGKDGLGIDLTADIGARIYQREVASEDDPLRVESGLDRSKKVSTATVWTRDEWYELWTDRPLRMTDLNNETGWELVKSGKHAFGRPPRIPVAALLFNHPEPHRKYQAYLNGMLDLKPRVDFQMALMLALTTAAAQKMKFLKRDPKATPSLMEDGGEIDLTTDATVAKYLPPGTTLETFSDDVSQGFVNALKLSIEEYEKATPPTPAAEISATTQPWTARLQIQVSSVLTKQGIGNQALAIQVMMRSIMRDIQTSAKDGGFGQPAYVYKRGADGQEDPSQVVGIEPDKVPSMEYYVSINAISAAEQITTVEHGAGLLERGLITEQDFFDNYLVVPNSSDYIAQLRGEKIFKTQLEGGIMAQTVGEVFGAKYILDPSGKFLGLGGSPVDPRDVLAKNGVKPKQQQPGMVNASGGGMSGPGQGMAPQLGPGNLRDQPPPNSIPQPPLLDGVAR